MKYFPFDSNITGYDSDGYPIYDRPADSSLLRGVITQFVSTGIFPTTDCFKVEASEGMLVTVKPGSAVINGVTAMEETTRTLTVQSSDDTYDRIDTVVLRYNNDISVRSIDLYVLEGTPAATPTPPTLTRQTDYYELGLANLYIPVNSAVISDERITDTRTDEERCGYAKGLTQDFVNYVNTKLISLQNNVDTLNTQMISVNDKLLQANIFMTNTPSVRFRTTDNDINNKIKAGRTDSRGYISDNSFPENFKEALIFFYNFEETTNDQSFVVARPGVRGLVNSSGKLTCSVYLRNLSEVDVRPPRTAYGYVLWIRKD